MVVRIEGVYLYSERLRAKDVTQITCPVIIVRNAPMIDKDLLQPSS